MKKKTVLQKNQSQNICRDTGFVMKLIFATFMHSTCSKNKLYAGHYYKMRLKQHSKVLYKCSTLQICMNAFKLLFTSNHKTNHDNLMLYFN